VIALDTNLLVYAHRPDTPFHAAAARVLEQLAESPYPWAIPWPCVHEFLSVVTGPAFGKAATPLAVALEAIRQIVVHPRCVTLAETEGHFELLAALCQRANLRGGAIQDARIAALCISHGVEELWSCDRDFQRFPDVRVRNPLIPSVHEPLLDTTSAYSPKAVPHRVRHRAMPIQTSQAAHRRR
jgi:toxin-antitoxin system PIN domain toxin